MNEELHIDGFGASVAGPFTPPSAAKARLLAWAEESDVRTRRARSSRSTIATGGALAVLGGMVITRLLTPRGRSSTSGGRVTGLGARLLSWALVAGVGRVLLPHVGRAVLRHSLPRPG